MHKFDSVRSYSTAVNATIPISTNNVDFDFDRHFENDAATRQFIE